MNENRNSGYGKFRSKFIRKLVRYPIAAVVMNWTFQSLFYMDPTERWFKMGLELILTAAIGLVLSPLLPWFLTWPIALLIAHTLNFLFNGQLWGVLKNYGYVRLNRIEFDSYIDGFGARAALEPAIEYVLVYGSVTRGEWSPTSDLDARILRKPGLKNGFRACCFLLRERQRALIRRFPLDAYVVDNEESLRKLSVSEVSTVLVHNV